MLDDMKHIILANMNVKLYSWPLMFRKVVQQQIWGEVVVIIPSFPQILSEFNSEKWWKLVHISQSYHKNKSGTYFLRNWVLLPFN